MINGKSSAADGVLDAQFMSDAGHWIDLSHAYSCEAVTWPTSQPFELTPLATGWNREGYFLVANHLSTAEHSGTHVDAPLHVTEGGPSIDQLSIDQLIGPAAVVDVSDRALDDRDYVITTRDLTTWESDHGRIADNAILVFNTGSWRHWPDPERYLGTARRGVDALPELRFPGLDVEAARWLIEHRHIKAIGIDTPSIDAGHSRAGPAKFATHRLLLGCGIPILENLANLDPLPAVGAFVIALPLKIEGGSGSPARIVARVPA